jgi:hypothetical protein
MLLPLRRPALLATAGSSECSGERARAQGSGLSPSVDADEDARLVPWPRQNVDAGRGQGKQLERSATNGRPTTESFIGGLP